VIALRRARRRSLGDHDAAVALAFRQVSALTAAGPQRDGAR
jgi:hypothetical protein